MDRPGSQAGQRVAWDDRGRAVLGAVSWQSGWTSSARSAGAASRDIGVDAARRRTALLILLVSVLVPRPGSGPETGPGAGGLRRGCRRLLAWNGSGGRRRCHPEVARDQRDGGGHVDRVAVEEPRRGSTLRRRGLRSPGHPGACATAPAPRPRSRSPGIPAASPRAVGRGLGSEVRGPRGIPAGFPLGAIMPRCAAPPRHHPRPSPDLSGCWPGLCWSHFSGWRWSRPVPGSCP